MKNHKKWVSEIFDRTAPEYSKNSNSFFNYFGKRLIEHVTILPGQHVLDIATGRGAVLFPLADAISPLGKVVGIDISPEMIKETSKEALKKNMPWIELFSMDAESLDFPDNHFDFVFCAFGLFLFPSISQALSEFKRVLKPKGKVAISTWGEDSILDLLINEEIRKICDTKSLIATPLWSEAELGKFLKEASFSNIQIFEETKTFLHETAEEWWNSLWNHGTRAKLEQMSPNQIADLHKKILRQARNLNKKSKIQEDIQVFYGIAEKSN